MQAFCLRKLKAYFIWGRSYAVAKLRPVGGYPSAKELNKYQAMSLRAIAWQSPRMQIKRDEIAASPAASSQ
ncbi:hypothetical protein D0C36_05890 [Mucilaginibacter conchicola]|uniref:Uncharacterized protein n=1 Tax=Mucilaginibacter conchicola TaxID=2303333 RepID=A0A372NY64_9SPHI|nr:hypothetical protein D0C36_05890 [Mucilaginibacter conchicola]